MQEENFFLLALLQNLLLNLRNGIPTPNASIKGNRHLTSHRRTFKAHPTCMVEDGRLPVPPAAKVHNNHNPLGIVSTVYRGLVCYFQFSRLSQKVFHLALYFTYLFSLCHLGLYICQPSMLINKINAFSFKFRLPFTIIYASNSMMKF